MNLAFALLFMSCNEIKNKCVYQYSTPPHTLEERFKNYELSLAYLGGELEANPAGQPIYLPFKNARKILNGEKFSQKQNLDKP